ncbi:hypothetical protein FOMPIDRAFT_88462 [Fomitopsis schrenkii]|uniref:CFEM domain-containing protein n=1 Tax=Fomitopsis schrenkii TaxID=2126942 RepID=S8F1Z8_FOMSC|nr:hypothetical protein FOMPIDRAFT_88462 [Fomitopsis schrenkii]
MYSPKLALLVAASAIGGALAQINAATPSGTGYHVDSCIYECISQAASSAKCSSLSDLPCICSSSKFEDDSNSCLSKDCTKADAQWGQAWYKDSCAYVSSLSSLYSELSTFVDFATTVQVSNSAQESSLSKEASTFAAHISSEVAEVTASYASAYNALSSSASVLLTASGETATKTASAGSRSQVVTQGFIVACVTTVLGLALGSSSILMTI